MLDTYLDIEIISGKEEANLIIANHIERITRLIFTTFILMLAVEVRK